MSAKLESKYAYYSVRNSIKIDGVRRVPSVCYPIPPQQAEEMLRLAAQGIVVLYEHKVRFLSGIAMPSAKDGPILVKASSSALVSGEFTEEA